MARRGEIRNNFTKGVWDELLRDRPDLEAYRAALLAGENVVVLPQGGASNRGGLRHKAKLSRRIRRIPLTSGMLTAPNGGTAANAIDKNLATSVTTAVLSADPWVILQVDLGVNKSLRFVDVLEFDTGSGSVDNALYVEHSLNGSSWTEFGRPFNMRDPARSRRFAAGPAMSVTARYVRVVVKGFTSGVGTTNLDEIVLWEETTKLSPVKRFGATSDRDATYTLVATDRNIDVFYAGAWQAAVAIPHRAEQLEVLTAATSRDTVLVFHPHVQPYALFRQGAHWEWHFYNPTFSNVPNPGTDTAFAAAQNEVQRVTITGIADGNTFTLGIEEWDTAAVTKSQNAGTMATDITNALVALPSVGSGPVVTVTTATATTVVFEVKFAGGTGSRGWPPLTIDVIGNDSAAYTTETLQDGVPASAVFMDKTTGWPRCGAFFQSRLVLAGFLSRPETVLMSKTGDYFNFSQASAAGAAAGIGYTLDTDEAAIIQHVFAGRHLQLFADSGEWYIADRTLDATQPSTFVNATRNGTRAGVAPVQVEGGTCFVQGSGDVLRDFIFAQDTEGDYTAGALSLFASELVPDMVDVAYRRAAATDEGNQVLLANRDGSAAVMVMLRAEKVLAFTKWSTDGKFSAFNVDAQRRVDVVVERTINGVTDLYFEQLDDGAILDASIAYSFGAPQTVVTGLSHLEAKSVWATADGYIYGPFTVASGQITLPVAASSGEVGLLPNLSLTPMPYRSFDRAGRVQLSPVRVHTVTLALQDSSAVQLAANGQAANEVPLRGFDGAPALDTPPLTNLFSGEVKIEGLLGWSRDGLVTLTRPRPAKLTLRAINMEIA